MIPNFFIVGAPKSGTTALYNYLKAHEDVFMSEPKELNYFSSASIKRQNLSSKAYIIEDEKKYKSHFIEGDRKIIGEASVSYLYYHDVPKKIKEFSPDAKITAVLRNPVERAYSHYLMDKRLGYVSAEFGDILSQLYSKEEGLHFQQYVKLGEYSGQVKRYLKVFGANQVRFYIYDSLTDSNQEVLKDLSAFLGITYSKNFHKKREHNKYKEGVNIAIDTIYKSRVIRRATQYVLPNGVTAYLKKNLFRYGKPPELECGIRKKLIEYYLDDINELEKTLDVNLSAWKK